MTEKYLALYHKIYELSYTVLRYSNVYGPRQGADGEGGVIYIFAKSLAENKPITISETAGRPGILFPSTMLFLPTWQLYIRRTAKL